MKMQGSCLKSKKEKKSAVKGTKVQNSFLPSVVSFSNCHSVFSCYVTSCFLTTAHSESGVPAARLAVVAAGVLSPQP